MPLTPGSPRVELAEIDGKRFLEIGPLVAGGGELLHELENMGARLRALSSRDHLATIGIDEGFRIEDLVRLSARAGAASDVAEVDRWLRRRLPRECAITVESGPVDGGGRALVEAVFARRGEVATSQRARYERAAGRIRVEAFELHVVEHCNLRCTHCCNMSPYVADKMLSVAAVEAQCRAMARVLDVDVFKIMGGEPLLHPEITAILRMLKETGISEIIRLFTNGLLLHKMGDDFWEALDHLTVSTYSSAPVKPDHLRMIQDKAIRFDVVLNIKPVDRFSEVMSDTRRDDTSATQAVYDACWLRHRCMVVREGVFYKCTRAAYQRDFQERLDVHGRDEGLDRALAGEGVRLDAPDFEERLLAYLNAGTPLSSCRFCHGSGGPLVPHSQLSKRDVREGRLAPLALGRAG